MSAVARRFLAVLPVLLPALALATLGAGGAGRAGEPAGHGGPVRSIVLSPDGRHALTGSFDYSMMYWQAEGERLTPLSRFSDNDAAVSAVAFVPGGAHALSASDDGTISLWDLAAGTRIARFEGHGHKAVALAVSADGQWAASASWDSTVRLWNLSTLKAGAVLSGHSGAVGSLAFGPGGNTLFSAGHDGIIRQWRLGGAGADGELEKVVYSHGWGVNVLKVLGNGTQILFGGLDGAVVVLDTVTGKVIRSLAGHERPVLSMDVSPDGTLAATGGADGLIQVWDTRNWELKFKHAFPYGPVWAIAIAGDDRSMFFAGINEKVLHWQMVPDKPFDVTSKQVPERFQNSEITDPGELYFIRTCSICHTLAPDDANRAGPTLHGIFGRRVGSLPGYHYSATLKRATFIWNEETIDRLFALGPEKFVPGTKMPLQRMVDAQDRKALIEYLKRATAEPAASQQKDR